MFSIGDLSRETGCKVETIRYYERVELMPEPVRTEGNQRRYGTRHCERLRFIRHARQLGFSLDAVRELLALSDDPDGGCARADSIARQHLDDVRDKIARLQTLETELDRMVSGCPGDRDSHCRIIEVLSDHRLCVTEH